MRQILYGAAWLFLILFANNTCYSQESRGTIAGKVADSQGAVIPGASVVVTQTETNTDRRTTTNALGYFQADLLIPGTYTVRVEQAGFKTSIRSGLVLSVGDTLELELRLEVGEVIQTVEVTGEAPMLETASASGGRLIDDRQITDLPFTSLNPLILAGLVPGMQWTGVPNKVRPFDNDGASSFNTMGGIGQNEYTMDGSPITGGNRDVGFMPPSDAVEEFKLETATFDSSYGHTSGATINVMTKAGTNKFHGSLYDQHWQQRWNAMLHFDRLAFEDQVRNGTKTASDPRQPSGRSNNFGVTLGGPMTIPKLYKGKDKFFFFVSYNGIYENVTETNPGRNLKTVPKMAWRQGDFSDLLAIDAVKYTIYDPRSSQLQGSRIVRTPFPGNKGIPILDPLYKFYEPLYPKPNNVPGVVSLEGTNNYLATAMPLGEKYNSMVNRYDYNISQKHRLTGRWFWNHRLGNRADWLYETMPGLATDGRTRINPGGGGDYYWIVAPNTIFDLGLSWVRYEGGFTRPMQTQYKPTDVGLPAYLDTKAGAYQTLPQIVVGGVSGIGDAYPGIEERETTGELKASLTSVRGKHSLKAGFDERRYWNTTGGPGLSAGSFTFNQTYMRAADNTTTASDLGLGWAAFMMGLPSAASVATNDSGLWSTRFRSLYFQDDWRASSRWHFTLGLRYEREGGITERFNRGMGGGFLYDAKLPFADAAEAAYAKSPVPEMPASSFKVLGATEYLGTRYNTYTDGTHHLLPRFGVVYKLNDKTVIRGGYGWFYDTFNVNNSQPIQNGFSQATNTIVSSDNGLTFCCGTGAAAKLATGTTPILDPFPVRATGGRFDLPYGNTLDGLLMAGVGTTLPPRNFSPPRQQRWRIGVQREITKNIVIEASYNGSWTDSEIFQRIDYLPQQYWATGTVRNQAVDDNLNSNVSNPFYIGNFSALQTSNPTAYNFLRNQSFFASSTVRKNVLLRALPTLNNSSGLRPGVDRSSITGVTKYHDLQLQVEKRFSKGVQTSVMYTRAYCSEQDYYRNQFDQTPSFRPADQTRPHRLVWTTVWEVPFGKGRAWANSGVVSHIVGGWALNWVYQYQSGPPTTWSNRFFYGDLSAIDNLFQHDQAHSKDLHVWFDPNIRYTGTGAVPAGFQGFEGRSANQPGSYQVNMFPTRLGGLLADGIRNWDAKVQRAFKLAERTSITGSVDLLNLTNHTNFGAPNTDPTNSNFGRVTTQNGVGRMIQFNLRLAF